MSNVLLLACLLLFASRVEGNQHLEEFLTKASTLASILTNVCVAPRGTEENPVRINGTTGASVLDQRIVGIAGFAIDELKVQSGQFRVVIVHPLIEVSGDLRAANKSRKFDYKTEHNMTLTAHISHKKNLHIHGDFNVQHHTGQTNLQIQENAFVEYAAHLESHLNNTLHECYENLVKFYKNFLDEQLRRHKSEDILSGKAEPGFIGRRRKRRQVHTVNAYADYVLKTHKPSLVKSDPMDLADHHENFSSTSLLLPIHANVLLSKGKLWGVSSLHRSGDVRFSPVGHQMRFVVPLGVNNLKLRYKALITIGKLTKNVQVTSSITNLEVTFIVHQSLSFNSKPTIHSVRVTKFGKIKVQYKGVGALDWLLSRLATYFVNSTTWDLVKHVEALLKKLLNEVLSKM